LQRRNDLFVERLPLVMERPWLAYPAATVLCLLAFGVRMAAQGILPTGYPFVSFFPAVILTSFLFGVRPGIFAALLCGLISWFFFVPPYRMFDLNANTLVALLFYASVAAIDVTLVHWMQRANYKLAVERGKSRTLAENRELLFKELQHRVSNNLQVAAALLSLHGRQITDERAHAALGKAADRLGLIGRISRALYDPQGQALGSAAYMRNLALDILESSGRQDVVVETEIDEQVSLHPDQAVPVALIVAEAISNALEHGLPDRSGVIRLRFGRTGDDMMRFEIVDDGRGLPEGFVLDQQAASLGLRIASTLARQLRGRFSLLPGEAGGTCALLEIPA
jgi:two-component sensor histidine kinase